MKKSVLVSALFALLAVPLFFACQGNKSYPELDRAIVDSLRATDIPGLFMAGSQRAQARPVFTPFCAKACVSKTVYWVQIGYTVTICQQQESKDVLTQAKSRKDSLGALLAKPVQYQVRHWSSNIGQYNLYCRQHGGPWIAEIIEEEICESCGPGIKKFNMVILGIPQLISWTWYGTMDDRPKEVQYIGEPFVRSTTYIDCNPLDHTSCDPNPHGGEHTPQ